MPDTKPKPRRVKTDEIKAVLAKVPATPKSRPRVPTEAELRKAYLVLEESYRQILASNTMLLEAVQRFISSWSVTRDLGPATAEAEELLRRTDLGGQIRIAAVVLERARRTRLNCVKPPEPSNPDSESAPGSTPEPQATPPVAQKPPQRRRTAIV
jgi:hypothetical protein